MKEKTFYKTLVSFNLDPNKIKTILKDKRLTATEKLILEAHMELRNNQNNKAIALLEKIPPSDLLFVESQRLLILGCASNNLSYFKKAEDYLLQSAKILKEMKINDFLFSAYSSLFWIYANLNEVSKMKNMLDELVAMPQDIEVHKIRLLSCQFCYYQMAGEDKQAHKILNKLEAVKSSIVEKDIIAYLIDKFMFYVHIENFDKCYETLADMKNYRKFHLSENYNYMKKLLDHLTKDVPLYAYIEEFEAAPLLFHQIKVIQALEERRPDIAHYHWDWLRATSEL